MKNNKFLLNTLLTGALFVILTIAMVIRVMQPAAVLPHLNIPNMALISLIVLLTEYYIAPNSGRCYVCIFLLSAVAFALLPLMAGFACVHTFWKLALIGGVVFTAVTWLFTSVTDRMASGPKAKCAAFVSALGLYLAFQCFAGILL